MKKHLVASLAVATTIGFFTPLTSQAFGLGKLELMSALNEPFKAEIDITALRGDEKDNLQVKLASQEEFQKAGLDRSFMLSQLQFDIVERDGQTKVLVTSKDAIKEPFLDFLLTASAGSGRLIREYTVLLDPPEFVMAETRTASTKPAPAPTPVAASTEVEVSESSTANTTTYQYADSDSSTGSSSAGAYSADSYKVQRNDTLWNIALETRPNSAISVHQMMMALLNENRSAFNGENVNGLKAGVTLKIPTQAQIEALSKSAAVAAFAEQNEAWKSRNDAAVTTVTETVSEPETADTDSEAAATDDAETEMASEEVEMAMEDTAAGLDTSTEEARLQLVAPEDDAVSEDDVSPNVAGNDELTQLSEQLTLAQETIEAQTQENIDANARMEAMEEQLETMRRLISLKDADLARLQSILEEEDPELAAEVQSVLQSEQDELTTGSIEAVEPTADALEATDAETANEQQQTVESSVEDITEEPATEVTSEAAETLNPQQSQVQSIVDKVKQFINDHKLETGAGLFLILLVLFLLVRRSKREVTWDEAVQKLDKDQPQDEGPIVVTPMRNDDEEVTDAPLAETSDEKTVAELVEQADMFVGYADYVQAKNSLEQARLQEPQNTLVIYKLLFVLYKQNQTEDFIALVEDANLDDDSYEWAEVKQWGQELAPDNELFSEQVVTQSEAELDEQDTVALDIDETPAMDTTAEADDEVEFDLDDFSDQTAVVSDAEEEKPAPEEDLDVDDDLLAFDTNFNSADSDDDVLELDTTETSESDDTLSFDLDTSEEKSEVEEPDLNNSVENEAGAPDIEFDVGDLDDIDEAETKLDLAAAYIDMGDPDGAKNILNEVLVEGSEEQKNRANDLLQNLS